jgi:hypothetical protein
MDSPVSVTDIMGGPVRVAAVDLGNGWNSVVWWSTGAHIVACCQNGNQEDCLDCHNTHSLMSHLTSCGLQGKEYVFYMFHFTACCQIFGLT